MDIDEENEENIATPAGCGLQIRCAAHSLQLAVKDGLKKSNCDNIINKVVNFAVLLTCYVIFSLEACQKCNVNLKKCINLLTVYF